VAEAMWLDGSTWLERARELKDEGWQLADLCGVDRLNLGGPRFEVAAQLLHHERKDRMTVHVAALDDAAPMIPSVVELWPTADFMEREAFDLMGITFQGHPDLRRIMMPDEWEGHPLRKDYGVGKIEIDFIPQPYLQIEGPGQSSRGNEAQTELDSLGQTRLQQAQEVQSK
jgi:NADH-quinone oxidoreductase subunit C